MLVDTILIKCFKATIGINAVITAADMAMLRACVQGEFAPVPGDATRLFAIAAQFVRAQLERDFDALTFAQRLSDPNAFNMIPQNGN